MFPLITISAVGRDSSFGTGTRYGLHGPGIEPLRGKRFYVLQNPSRSALGHTQSPQIGTGDFTEGKAAGAWR